MDFRKPKSKATDHDSSEIGLETLSKTQIDIQHVFDLEKLQNEIEYKEKTLDIFIKQVSVTFDANIDDMIVLMDQKRPIYKIYKQSICELWIQLKTLEQIELFSLVTFLRTYQLHRLEMKFQDDTDDSLEIEQHYFINRRRSRLTHFHIRVGSDEFNFNIDSYVGLMIFSYDDQSKFILNGHHCQRGDIIIKQMKNLPVSHRGIYDAVFKWYFNRSLDEKFFGLGFFYSNKKWRFDLLTCDTRDILSYEYRIFDMFLLTHWLTNLSLPHNVQEMAIIAKDLLLKQFDAVKNKLNDQQNSDLLDNWHQFIGSDMKDLQIAIKHFIQTTEKQIDTIFDETAGRQQTVSSK
ncbi:hypothetical protein I4U23_018562 [Adineta vaga]|nr:hypothetical protein I4U23_018562 [Adineta vaga]